MRLYLAARYALKDTIAQAADYLQKRGHIIMSDWHKEVHPPNVKVQDLPHEENQMLAMKDFNQIHSSEAMLFWAEHPDTATVRGGRHVEFGIGLALNKQIYVLGPKENIFHYLTFKVKHIDGMDEIK